MNIQFPSRLIAIGMCLFQMVSLKGQPPISGAKLIKVFDAPCTQMFSCHLGLLCVQSNRWDVLTPKEKSQATPSSEIQPMGVGIHASSLGRLFFVTRNRHRITLFEQIDINSKNAICDIPVSDDDTEIKAVSNETGRHVWIALAQEVVVVDTEFRVVTQRISIQLRDLYHTRLAATENSLLIGTPFVTREGLNWRVEKLDAIVGKTELIGEYLRTMVLRMETDEVGNIIVSGRDELHAPESGFLSCIEKGSLKTRWRINDVMPLSLSCCGPYILWTDGGPMVSVNAIADGSAIGTFSVSNANLTLIAANRNFIWALSEDQRSVWQVTDAQRLIQNLK
jgi:hypothetical protein